MEDISKSLDELLAKAGQANRYQFIIVILFLFQFICSNFLNSCLPYLQSPPFIILQNTTESIKLNYTLCEKNFEIDRTKKISSLIIDYEIYCNKNKVSSIEISLFLGMTIGSSTMYLFSDRFGRKKTLLYFIPCYILLLLIFFFIKSYFFFMLLNLFFIGITGYIIILTMIVYICEIIKFKNIPIFVAIIVTGAPISSILNHIFFSIFNENWRVVILVFIILNLFTYILICYIIIGSPIFFFMNNDINTFEKHLIRIAQKNKVNLNEEDFKFLEPYKDPLKSKRNTAIKVNIYDNNNSSLLMFDNNITYEEEDENKDELIENNEEVDNVASIKFFLANYKLKDYTILDIFEQENQAINFIIMSYLWIISEITIDGINFQNEKFQVFNTSFSVNITINILEIVFFIIVVYLLFSHLFGVQNTLISFQLISSFLISISLLITDEKDNILRFILLYCFRLCWSGTYLIIYILSTEIYPTVIRSKGLGLNIAFGKLGGIFSPFFIESLDLNNIILYFLVFTFFSLLFTYALPQKIGSITLDYANDEVKKKNKKKNENENENDDSDEEEDDDNYDDLYKKKMNKRRRSSFIENSIYFNNNRVSSLKNERKSNIDNNSLKKINEEEDKITDIINTNHNENMKENNEDDDGNISSENISANSN